MSSAWTPSKVAIFKEQYYEFRHHVHINSKDLGGGAILGDHTFVSQQMLLDAIFDALSNDVHDIKVLKSRQLGVSTETRALSLFWNGVHNGLQGAMVYDSDDNKLKARQDLVYVINSLPARLKFPRVKSDNRSGLVLDNDSSISFKAAGTRSNRSGGGLGRSIGINFAHCSEMCSWENTEGVVSFQQALSEIFENRLYIWESTARGPGLWSDMWDDASKDTSNQKTVFLGWWSKDSQKFDKASRAFHQYGLAPPSIEEQKRIDAVKNLYGFTVTQEQLAWYRRKMDPAGEAENDVKESREDDDFKNAEQPWTEHEAFIASGSTFFPADRITEIRSKDTSNKYKPFRYYPGTSFVTCQVQSARNWRETQLKVWEEPVDDAVYVLAVDPAFGHDDQNDRSAIQIMRCYADCIEQVAEFADPLTPTNHLAWIVWSLVGWYGGGRIGNANNPVHTIFELNGPGDAVWLEFKAVPNIVKNGYLRIEAKEKGLENIFNNVRNYIYTRSDSMGIGSAYHFKTTNPTKVSIMERLRGYTIDGTLIVHSQDTLDEMRNVTRNGDVIKAEGRKKDDRVITLALGCRAWDDRARKALIAQNRTKRADQAKRASSITDQYQLFSANTLQDFFNAKKRARRLEANEIRRAGWRGRH